MMQSIHMHLDHTSVMPLMVCMNFEWQAETIATVTRMKVHIILMLISVGHSNDSYGKTVTHVGAILVSVLHEGVSQLHEYKTTCSTQPLEYLLKLSFVHLVWYSLK